MAVAYHIIVIIVLIAMMSNSYEAIKENEETEFDFQRISMWIEYVRNEKFRPPPMNLIPDPRQIMTILRRVLGRGIQHTTEVDTERPICLTNDLSKMRRNVTRRLMYRYKVKNLVKNNCNQKSEEFEKILIRRSYKKAGTRF